MTAAQLADGLVRRGVETRPFFLGLHEQPALRGLVVSRPGPLPVTERIASQGLYLPTGADLTAAEVEYVATSLAQVLGGQAD
jgi:perosamine synthetase